MRNEKFEKAVKEYKEKSDTLRDRLLLTTFASVYIAGFILAALCAIFKVEANFLTISLICLSIAFIAFVCVIVCNIIIMLNDIKINTWITAHKGDLDGEEQ